MVAGAFFRLLAGTVLDATEAHVVRYRVRLGLGPMNFSSQNEGIGAKWYLNGGVILQLPARLMRRHQANTFRSDRVGTQL
jgi:hypothetical protein